MLLNNAARDLLKKTSIDTKIISHDWWAYILITGCGGDVHYSNEPTIYYRQHDRNIIGSNIDIKDRIARFRKLLLGSFREWNNANLSAISSLKSELTQDNLRTLDLFEKSRQANLFNRLYLLQQSGVHRQNILDTLGLVVATILKRL